MTTHTHVRRLALAGLCATAAAAVPLAAPGPASAEPSVQPAQRAAGQPSSTAVSTVELARTGRRPQRIRHGARLKLGGHVEPRVGGRIVILRRALRGRGYRDLARTRTRANGSFRFRVRARRSSAYRAVAVPPASLAAADGAGRTVSATRRIAVVARVSAGVGRQRHVDAGERVHVRGRLRPAGRRKLVRLQLRSGKGWRTVDRARTRRGGRFRAAWRPSTPGTYRLRVRFAGDKRALGAGDRLARVSVYRLGGASWYGPGFYGNHTACGGILGAGTLGVAHKSLPCGTRVTFRYGGRSVTVPVIDRGPFVGGRDWDLTAATKAALGFPDVGTVRSTR